MAQGPLESEVWKDPISDTINVKVYQWCKSETGVRHRRGVILRLTEEAFFSIAEGQDWPFRSAPRPERLVEAETPLTRWDLIRDSDD